MKFLYSKKFRDFSVAPSERFASWCLEVKQKAKPKFVHLMFLAANFGHQIDFYVVWKHKNDRRDHSLEEKVRVCIKGEQQENNLLRRA